MKRDRVIFLIYHGQGHFNACFKVARTLQPEFDVTFAGHAYFEQYVLQHGFEFYALTTVPFGLGFETWVNAQEKKKNIWWSCVCDRFSNRLFRLRENSLREMVEKLEPAYLLIDSWQSTDFLALYKILKEKKLRTAFIQTMLSTVIDGTPPLTSTALPEKREVKNAHDIFKRNRILKQLKQKIKYFGRDNTAIINAAIRDIKPNPYYLLTTESIFSPAFNLTEFILAPLEFEFPQRKGRENQIHLGSAVDVERVENVQPAFATLLSKLVQTGEPIIYCSFGTTDAERSDVVRIFIEKLLPALDFLKVQCILSSPSEAVRTSITGRCTRLHVFQQVPQLLVLKRAKVLITHGGLNSIKEAIATETPMLVYPSTDHTDTPGNSARVLFHKLGLVGNLQRDTEKNIREKLMELLSNPSFRSNISAFNKAISQKNLLNDFPLLLQRIKPVE